MDNGVIMKILLKNIARVRNYPDVTILYNHGITHRVVVDNNLALFRSLCWMLGRSLVWFWPVLVSVIRLFIGPVMKTMLALVLRSLHVFIGLYRYISTMS